MQVRVSLIWGVPIASMLLLGIGCATQSNQHVRDVQPDDLIIENLIELKPAKNLTHSQSEWDLAILIYALENGYGGRKYVPQESFQALLHELGD